MHHSSNMDPELRRRFEEIAEENGELEKLRRPRLGATGRFPEGKLTQNDEGEIAIAIAHTDKKVVIDFGKPIAWIGFSPQQARDIAAALTKHAEEADRG